MHYMLINPATGRTMGETRYGLVTLPPEGTDVADMSADEVVNHRTIAPKLLTSMHVAENHQSTMNCTFGTGWEIATVDLMKGIVAVTRTEPVD